MLDFAQLVGFLALLFVLLSFSFNNRENILFLASISQLLFSIHYFLLNAYTGAILSIISSIRAYIFNNKDKYNIKNRISIPFIFMIIIIIFTVFSWEGERSLLLMAALIIEVSALWNNNPKLIRLLMLLTAPLWLTYNYLVNSYGGVIASFSIFMYILISIIHFDIVPKLNEKALK